MLTSTVLVFGQEFAVEDALPSHGCDAISSMTEFMVRVVAIEDALPSHEC
jgi:hypothetical protein